MVKELPKDFLNIGQLKTYQEEIWNMYKYLDDIVNELTSDTSAKSFENFDKIFNIRTKDVEFNDFRDLYFSLQDIHNKISVLIAFLDKQKTEQEIRGDFTERINGKYSVLSCNSRKPQSTLVACG